MAKRNLRTDAQLVREGYVHSVTRKCTYAPCVAQIENWRTPAGRLMPFDRLTLSAAEASALGVPVESMTQQFVSVVEPHFGSCKGLAERKQARAEGRDQEAEPVEQKEQ